MSFRVDNSKVNWLHLAVGMTVLSHRSKLIDHYRTRWTKEWLHHSCANPCLVLEKEFFFTNDGNVANVRLSLMGERGVFYISSPDVSAFDWKIVP